MARVEAGTLKRTPLYEAHVEAGAKLVPFAGWEMPVQYDGISAEHLRVRGSCGVFDVSHMGEIETEGPQAAELLQRLLSNDVSKIEVGGAQYSCLCREDGGVLDDLFTYRLADERYLTVTNAANHDRDLEWFEAHAVEFEAEVRDRIDAYGMLAVQGPRGPRHRRRLADGELPARFRTAELSVAGAPTLVCGTGYTGEDGVELLIPPEDARAVWDALIGAGADPGRARRTGHASAGGQLLPLRQRPDRGADTDRGGSRLVRQGGHRLRRLGGLPGGSAMGAEPRSWSLLSSRVPAFRGRATGSSSATRTSAR